MTARRLCFLLLALLAGAAHATCVRESQIQEAAAAPADKPLAFGLRAEQYRSLLTVKKRLAEVAGTRPELLVCELPQPNALARFTAEGLPIVVFDPRLLKLLDHDMVASVMAHEFAHLQMKHTRKWAAANDSAARDAASRLAQKASQGRLADDAVKSEIARFVANALQNSRELETEADDIGYKFMTAAGFDPAAASRAGKKLLGSGLGNQFTDYHSTHPGWLERIARLDELEVGNRYALRARLHIDKQDWPALHRLVDDWLGGRPEDGQAWYYQGIALRHGRRPPLRPLDAFRKAVTLDRNNAEAWLQYCVELYRENYRLESAQCSRHIKYSYLLDEYRAQTFRSRLAVGGEAPAASALHAGRTASGSLLITNDAGLAGRPLNALPPAWVPMP